MAWNGLGVGLANLWRLADAETRSISPENFTGEKGRGGMATEGTGASHAARDLGQGWKISPSVRIAPGETFVLADIEGSGAIQHIWLTPTGGWRNQILRMYWDDDPQPAVECPVGDFFACGWGEYAPGLVARRVRQPGQRVQLLLGDAVPQAGRITLTNESDEERIALLPDHLHAVRRARRRGLLLRPVPARQPAAEGRGRTRSSTACAAGASTSARTGVGRQQPGWWGEGEIKFFIDGDGEFPTICGTGTEDYFCGSYNFDVGGAATREFTTPYAGMPQVLRPDGTYRSQQRFGLYRWHITDPIRFEPDLRVTMQALGWRRGGRYLQLQDDIASVAYWYQTLPLAPFPPLPDRDAREIN